MVELDLILNSLGYYIIGIVQIMIKLFIWYLIIKSIIKSSKRKANKKEFKKSIIYTYNSNSQKKEYIDIKKEQLAEFNTENLKAFKEYFYNLFIEFENAYNNLDYSVMRLLSTKQLFQNYYTGITLDLEKGNKRIIQNIQKKNVIIFEVFTSTAKQVVTAMIEIDYLNYMIDKNGKVISGNRNKSITEKFEVTFRKDFERNEIIKCTNCGATVEGNVCDFCRTKIKNVEFKLSSIKKIIDN